jgi:hypothetical protein
MGHRRCRESALDLDPPVPGAGIGDGLDDAHVANAVLEIGMGTSVACGAAAIAIPVTQRSCGVI